MDEHGTGLVLRTRRFSETSLIVHWLTADFGRVATLAKGALRPKSPFLGKLDLFYLADFSFQRSRRSDLHTLREVSVREFNTSLRQNLACLQQAAYFSRLLEQTTETETPLPGFFRLLREALAALATRTPQPLTVFAFELKLLDELGVRPDLERSRLTAGAKEILRTIQASDWPTVFRLRLSQSQGREIVSFLAVRLGANLERIPDGRTEALGEI